jgi:hypothetical protein
MIEIIPFMLSLSKHVPAIFSSLVVLRFIVSICDPVHNGNGGHSSIEPRRQSASRQNLSPGEAPLQENNYQISAPPDNLSASQVNRHRPPSRTEKLNIEQTRRI